VDPVFAALRRLSDAELIARLRDLAARERDETARLVAHLVELERRDLHLRHGYGSLFEYCRDALSLSEHEAYNRIAAARAARRFPVILDKLAEGAVNPTTVRLLAPLLSHENCHGVLESARGKRRVQVEEMIARLSPLPDVPESIRKLPPLRPGSAPTVVPLSPDRYKVQLTISGDTLEKLRLAKDMMRHAEPSGSDAVIVERALSALLSDLARKKFAATEKPRVGAPGSPDSRHIPAEVKRVVWLRDLGRCAFVGEKGRRCDERAFLEFHHRKPYAAGGDPTAENIQLRCRQHNQYEARAYFGVAR
jgi:hypothetical protein